MEYQYPNVYDEKKGSYTELCARCGKKKKHDKDCQRCISEQELDESAKDIQDLTDSIKESRRQIKELIEDNLKNEEQIRRNQERIKILKLSLESDNLSLEIQKLESRFGVEVVSENARVHNGKLNVNTTARLETHCTIVRVVGHEDVYFGHVTLIITYSNKELGEYIWHYGVKTKGTLPERLDNEFWQTYYKGQTQYDAEETNVSDFGKFRYIPSNTKLSDMMKSHFKDCISFFNQPEWPPNQIWGKDSEYENEKATDRLERLKQLKIKEASDLKYFKSKQSSIDTAQKKLVHEAREARQKLRIEKIEQYIASRKEEEKTEKDSRIENVVQRQKQKDEKRRLAKWNADQAQLRAEQSLEQSAKAKAEAAKAKADAAKAKADAAKAEEAKAEAAELAKAEAAKAPVQEIKSSGSGKKVRKQARDTKNDPDAQLLAQLIVQNKAKAKAEQAKAEQTKAEEDKDEKEKPTLDLPLAGVGKYALVPRRLVTSYQKAIDDTYEQYLELKNLVLSSKTADIPLLLIKIQKYIQNIDKYIKEVEKKVKTVECSSSYDLVLKNQEKTLQFLKMKQTDEVLSTFIKEYCDSILYNISKLKTEFSDSEKVEDTKVLVNNIALLITKYIQILLPLFSSYKQDLEQIRDIVDLESQKTINKTLEFLRENKKHFDHHIEPLLYERYFITEIKHLQLLISSDITETEQELQRSTNQTEASKNRRSLIRNYRGFIIYYTSVITAMEKIKEKFKRAGVDIERFLSLENELIDIYNKLNLKKKYLEYCTAERPNIINFYRTSTYIDNESDDIIRGNLYILEPLKFIKEENATEFIEQQRKLKLKGGNTNFSTKDILQALGII
jgi:hypothetical protein